MMLTRQMKLKTKDWMILGVVSATEGWIVFPVNYKFVN